MTGILAGGRRAIVAARTVSADGGMIKAAGRPGIRGMTGIAFRRGRDMRCRLAGGDIAVVAIRAAAGHCRMVDPGDRRPAAGRMAGLALVVGRNVLAALAGGLVAIVTADAVAGDTVMIKPGRLPVLGGVTGLTLGRGRDMAVRLAHGNRVVVTGRAFSLDLVMIDTEYRRPGYRPVTGLAGNAAVDVTG